MQNIEGVWSKIAVKNVRSVAIGVVAALMVSLLLLLFFAMGISSGLLGEALMDRLTLATGVLGALAGGVTAARLGKGKGLLLGGTVGGLMFGVLFFFGALFYGVAGLNGEILLRLAGCLCGGMLAGLLSKGKMPKGKRRRRRK